MAEEAEARSTRVGTPVVVTTVHRGVFFGYYNPESESGDGSLLLLHARQCVYWSPAMKGVLGLTTAGPDADCRIGPAAPALHLMGVTSIARPTSVAVAAWEAAPWAGETGQR